MKRLCTVFAVLFFTFTAAGLCWRRVIHCGGPGSSTLHNRSLIRVQRRRVRRELGMPRESQHRGVNAAGKPMAYDTPSRCGKDHPTMGAIPTGTDRLHQANERNKVEAISRGMGKACRDATFSVSKDGRS